MAPLRDNRNNDGTRNRQLLNAHTGAGVNANRPAAICGRGGSSRTTGSSRRAAPGNQRGNQRRSPVSTPGRRIAERLNFESNRRRRVEEDATSSNDARPQAQHNRSGQHPSANISARESIVSISLRHQQFIPNPHSTVTRGSCLEKRFKQRTPANVSTQETQARETPRPRSTTTTTTYNTFLRASTAPNLSSIFAPPPSPPSPPISAAASRRQHDDAAAARRAFSNPNLRAIMSNKPYPRQRKKALSERPILKQGLKKEYK
ncbi:ubiquitin-conjugating enzyme E2 H [Curvularia clavata]|uniref:Ubiquitin-conjugating enzyme E2 H n=1 Tax=Curvularia clavata TaxID=95742 RepID=A0A9Q9DX94_CURCL|nr:ubiquitin-conjugating enzyme E2 H [Curvularia clavata]